MIVELIGCAGAGKTTLGRMVCAQGVAGRTVVAMPDLLLDRALLRRVRHPTAVNVVQEIGGFPWFLGAWRCERDFVAFAGRTLLRHGPSAFHRVNCMRGIVRKVGMFHLASRRAPREIVLSDEGTLVSAYDLLVTTRVDYGRPELEEFARLVPVPDAVVYVRAPVASLVERATSRPDRRRQHRGRSRAQIEEDVHRTVELFDLLTATPPLRGRVLVVDNEDADELQRRQLASEIAALLRTLPSPGTTTAEHLAARRERVGAELRG